MKIKLLTLTFIFFITQAFAKDLVKSPKQKTDIQVTKCYINLNFAQQDLKNSDRKFKSNFGGAFTAGRTFFVNRNKPIGGVLRFGIDATWADLNYANYTILTTEEGKKTWHQGEIGMHVGPSFVVSPVRALNVHGYFRYAPTFSAIISDGVNGGFASFFMTGMSVSYGVIGIGFEKRWGNGSYKKMFDNKNNEDGSKYESEGMFGQAIKLKTSGYRFYITFRF